MTFFDGQKGVGMAISGPNIIKRAANNGIALAADLGMAATALDEIELRSK